LLEKGRIPHIVTLVKYKRKNNFFYRQLKNDKPKKNAKVFPDHVSKVRCVGGCRLLLKSDC
jgi:hypothetical protein